MNNKRGTTALSVILLVVLVVVLAYLYFRYSKPAAAPAGDTINTSTSTSGTTMPASQPAKTSNGGTTSVAGWKRYYFKGSGYLPAMSFEYPSTWRVEANVYQTVGDRTAGLPGQVASISARPQTGSPNAIVIGGFQATCGANLIGQTACYKNIPVRVVGTVSAATFTHLVSSLQ